MNNELDTMIDRGNNAVGIQIGLDAAENGLSRDEVADIVVQAYDRGELFCGDANGFVVCS